MAVIEQVVDIVKGMGGPNGDSIPIYADKNAPKGAWVFAPGGGLLMLQNTEISGIQYIMVNPSLLSEKENEGSKFITYTDDGKPYYARIWIRDPYSGRGMDYAPGVEMWAECTHLMPNNSAEPGEESDEDISIFLVDWRNRTITLSPE
jgi:hypothetical protein